MPIFKLCLVLAMCLFIGCKDEEVKNNGFVTPQPNNNQPVYNQPTYSTPYGEKMTFLKGEVYYKNPVQTAEVQSLGNYLVNNQIFTNNNPVYVQLLNTNGTYEVRFVTVTGAANNHDTVSAFQLMTDLISSNVFPQRPMQVHMCDNSFNSVKVLYPANANYSTNNYSNNSNTTNNATTSSGGFLKKNFKRGEIHYDNTVVENDVNLLGAYLLELGYFSDSAVTSVVFRKNAGAYQVLFIVKQESLDNMEVDSIFQTIGGHLTKLFNNQKVLVYLSDPNLTNLKEVAY